MVSIPSENFRRSFPTVVTSCISGRPQKFGIFLAALDSPGARLLLDDYVSVSYATPGYLLVLLGSSRGARAGTLIAQPFDPDRLEITGEPSVIAERVEYPDGLGRGAFSVSDNGTLVYNNFNTPSNLLTWFDRSGRPHGTVGGSVSYAVPSLSPDEKTVVAVRVDPETRSPDVWLIDLARGVSSRLTDDPAGDSRPTWSPDSDRIVFASARGLPPNLYLKAVRGGVEERLFKSTHNTQPTDWSRGSQFLAYVSLHPKTQWDLYLLPMSGAAPADQNPVPYLQTKFNEHSGQFSPDGKWLAYVSDASGINEVYVGDLPRHSVTRAISINGGTQPRWRADGRELFYLRADGMLMAVGVKAGADFQPGAPFELFRTDTPRSGGSGIYGYQMNYAVSRDGQRFLIVTTAGAPDFLPTKVVLNWYAAARNGS